MVSGLIHLYFGDGKGKTSAALGLALRALGRGKTVALAQFLKGNRSGERAALRELSGFTEIQGPETVPFPARMTPAQRKAAAEECSELFRKAAETPCELLILDEVCDAVNEGFLPGSDVLSFLDCRPPEQEVALTGRNPPSELLERADYCSEIRKVRHPYDDGQAARLGIEY